MNQFFILAINQKREGEMTPANASYTKLTPVR